MSCWVVPAIAAELWGLSVQQIMERIRWGHVASKTELGFTLVDVAPTAPQTTPQRRVKQKGPTFTLVPQPQPAAKPQPAPKPQPAVSHASEMVAAVAVEEGEPPVDEDQDQAFDWRKARRETSRLRIGPRSRAGV